MEDHGGSVWGMVWHRGYENGLWSQVDLCLNLCSAFLSVTLNNSLNLPKSFFPHHAKTYKGGGHLYHRVAVFGTKIVTGSL